MRRTNSLCDIELIYKDEKYLAHSCMLFSQSPAIAGLLQARIEKKNEWSVFKPLVIILKDTDASNAEPLKGMLFRG